MLASSKGTEIMPTPKSLASTIFAAGASTDLLWRESVFVGQSWFGLPYGHALQEPCSCRLVGLETSGPQHDGIPLVVLVALLMVVLLKGHQRL